MSDKRTLLAGLWLGPLLVLGSSCVTEQKQYSLTVVGSSSHEPYPAKPEYLGTRALPDPALLRRGNVAARLHVSAPPAADTSGDDSDPGVAESAEAPEPATEPEPERGGTFTVAPSNEASQPNREPDVQPPWQPTIQPNPPQDHP